MKKLQSVSNDGAEASLVKHPAVTEATTATAPAAALATTRAAQRRLVVGKSTVSLDKPDPTGVRSLSLLHDKDERTRIVDADDAPWRMICSLSIKGPWADLLGTGWLVGPKTIVTAGHCVFSSKEMGGWATSITVKPSVDAGTPGPFTAVEATQFRTLDVWKNTLDADFDIGAILLDQPLGDTLGFFQVASMTDDQLKDRLVNISGYPADPGNGEQQWWAKNRIKSLTPRRIFYDVDTTGGQSGAPVFILDDPAAAPTVVGIHAYGIGGTPESIAMQVNSAPRIIPEVVAKIREWIDEGNQR